MVWIESIIKNAGYGLSALQVLLADIPTTAEFDARTLLAADYFDFTTDSVIVGTNNDKTGYALSNVGADLILKTSDIWSWGLKAPSEIAMILNHAILKYCDGKRKKIQLPNVRLR